MAATVTLVYDCSVGIQNPTNFIAAVAAVNVTQELPLLGMILGPDNTIVNAGKVRRTIVLNVLPKGNFWFPTNQLLIAATKNLYSMKLALQVPCSVVAADPVVA